MSASGKALAQAIGGFGQSVQNLGETIYKVDADNEATKIQLSLAAQIEEFQKNLLTDPEPGTPGAQTPEGYLAKWEKFTQGLQSQAGQAKNPLARQEVNNYLGKVLPSQGTNVAKLQLSAWSENQKVDRRKRVLDAAMVRAPEEALNFAATEYGFLLQHNAISAAEYSQLMNEASAPILENALYQKGMAAFKEKGASDANAALYDQVLFKTDKDTFTVSDTIRDRVRARLNASIQAEYTKTTESFGVLLSNARAKAMGKPRLDENGNELPILTLDDVDPAKLPPDIKEQFRDAVFQMDKLISDATYTDAEGELWDAFDILYRMNKGEAVSAEDQKKALTAAMIAEKAPPQKRAMFTSLLQGQDEVSKTNKIEIQRTEVGKAMAALRRSAYSTNGVAKDATDEDAALIGNLKDSWLDTFTLIPANELSGLKEERARLEQMRADRIAKTSYTDAENAAFDLFGKLAGAASGLAFDEATLPKEADVAAAIAKIDPSRQGSFKQEATQLFNSIAKVKQGNSNDVAFWNLAKKADTYRDTGSGLSIDEIDAAVKAKTITSSQATYLSSQMNQADDIKKAETLAKTKGEDALARYKLASEAYRNLQKKNAGETLPDGAKILDTAYAREIGLDANELQYWDGVIERTAATKKQLDAIKTQGSREKKLAAALANSYAAIRAGKEDPDKPGLTQEMVEKEFENVDDPEGYKSWVSVAEQVKSARDKKDEDAKSEEWRQTMWKAEAASEKKARGEDIGTEAVLSQELIDTAPPGVKEEEKAYFSRRATTIGDTATAYQKKARQEDFYVRLGNTRRIADGEQLPKGTPVLTFDQIWENEDLTFETKISAHNFLRQAIGGKEAGPSESDQKIALDKIEEGAKILKRIIKDGDTQNTTWTYSVDGKSYTIDLAKDGTASWDMVVRKMTPMLAGHLADVEDFRGYFTGQKIENPRYQLADKAIEAYEKKAKTMLATSVKQKLRNWMYSQADQNPSMDSGKLAEIFEKGITAKEVSFNFQKGLDLDTSVRNKAEDFVDWIAKGEAQLYMGQSSDGLPKPAHPAVQEMMEQYAGKFREAMNIVPGWKNVKVGPKGQALETWWADGQRAIVITKEQAGKDYPAILKAVGFGGSDPNMVKKVEFFLGNVDGQAHIIKRTTTTGNGAYDQALYGQAWSSIYPTDKDYTYESVDARNGKAPGQIKPGQISNTWSLSPQ